MSPAGHLKVVDECDYYVLVIGARYGSTDAAGRRLIDLRRQRIRCKTMDCVEVCPVDCFYEGENNLAGKGTAPDA
jgi:ferredoxin